MLDLGVLVRYDGKVLAASYLDKYKATQAANKALKALKRGHHADDKARIELELKEISEKFIEGYNESFGEYEFYVITYSDKKGRAYTYKGANPPKVSKDEFTNVRATVKLSEYKGDKQTVLQRFHIPKK